MLYEYKSFALHLEEIEKVLAKFGPAGWELVWILEVKKRKLPYQVFMQRALGKKK